MPSKLNEALEHVKLAEKALKTSLFKWSPDYDTAASEYTKAATKFKLAQSSERAKDAYIKAAEMQEKLGSLFQGAKLLMQAAGILKDLKQWEDAVQLMEKASSMYRENGSHDTAAMAFAKAAKMCENDLPNKSYELYSRAAEICADDEKLHDASDHLKNAAKMLVKQKNYIKACEIMNQRMSILKQIQQNGVGYQVILCTVITYLSEGDIAAAENAYNVGFDFSGFGESDESLYCEQFIKAFNEGDEELLKKTRSQPLVTHLDTEYAKLAKALKLDESQVKQKSAYDGLTDLERLELNDVPEVPIDLNEEPPDEEGGLC